MLCSAKWFHKTIWIILRYSMGVFVYVTDALGLTATQDFIIRVAKAPE